MVQPVLAVLCHWKQPLIDSWRLGGRSVHSTAANTLTEGPGYEAIYAAQFLGHSVSTKPLALGVTISNVPQAKLQTSEVLFSSIA